jgi:hypothetical protein
MATGVYQLEDGRTIFCTSPLSDVEMLIYRDDPATFFGVLKGVGDRSVKTPLELYDFLFATYSKSTREKLLEFMAKWPEINAYRDMPQQELAQIYCALLAEQEGRW